MWVELRIGVLGAARITGVRSSHPRAGSRVSRSPRSPRATPSGREGMRRSTASLTCTMTTSRFSRTTASTRCTCRCRPPFTGGGRSPPCARASTCSARSRSRRTQPRPTGRVRGRRGGHRGHGGLPFLPPSAPRASAGDPERGRAGADHDGVGKVCVPIPPGRDIRWNLDLGGGGLLDVGYYPVRMLRDLLGGDPSVGAVEMRSRGGIDRTMRAALHSTKRSTPRSSPPSGRSPDRIVARHTRHGGPPSRVVAVPPAGRQRRTHRALRCPNVSTLLGGRPTITSSRPSATPCTARCPCSPAHPRRLPRCG